MEGQAEDPYAFGAEQVVQPSIKMDPHTQLPVRNAAAPFCHAYDDVLAVLNGHKTVAVMQCDMLTRPRLTVGDTAAAQETCGGKTVGSQEQWLHWLAGLRERLTAVDVVSWRHPEAPMCYVFHRAYAAYAAAACLLMHPTRKGGGNQATMRAAKHLVDHGGMDYVIGRLLGYGIQDIEAWYLGRVLSEVMGMAWPPPSGAPAPAGADEVGQVAALFRKRFYEVRAPVYEEQLAQLLQSPAVAQLAQQMSLSAVTFNMVAAAAAAAAHAKPPGPGPGPGPAHARAPPAADAAKQHPEKKAGEEGARPRPLPAPQQKEEQRDKEEDGGDAGSRNKPKTKTERHTNHTKPKTDTKAKTRTKAKTKAKTKTNPKTKSDDGPGSKSKAAPGLLTT